MPKIYYAFGPSAQLTEVLGADDSIRNQIPGDVHLVSLDGRSFHPFFKRPAAEDHEALVKLSADDGSTRPLDFPRGIVQQAFGDIEEIEM